MAPSFLLMVSAVLSQGGLCAASDLPPDVEKRLQELKLSYEGFLLKNVTFPYEAAVKVLNAMVLPALEREANNAAQRRDLEDLVRIKADVERIKTGGLLTDAPTAPPPSLKNIYATYGLELGKIEAARNAKTADAIRRYEQGLKLVQDEMTLAQRVEAAMTVKQLRDALQQATNSKTAFSSSVGVTAKKNGGEKTADGDSSVPATLESLVKSMGGAITPGTDGPAISFTGKRLTTAELLQLGSFKKIRVFDWNGGGGLDDAGMAAFDGMRDLYGLMLWSVGKFSDEGLRHLRDCRKLEYLNIGANTGDFTGEGLKYITGSSDLRSLTLNFCGKFEGKNLRYLIGLKGLENLLMSGCRGVTDEHVDLLLQIPSLTTLMLRATSISDKGLLKLAALPNLQEVHASAPTISKQGIEALKRLLPELKVEYFTP